jgi:hypothetical protein
MSKTARRTWQLCEARLAAFFGVRRQVCSGSSGREDVTASDSTHPTLFLESKHRARNVARTWLDAAKKQATKERKTPVLGQFKKHCEDFLISVLSEDFLAVAAEKIAILDPEERLRFESMVRQVQDRARARSEAS